MTIVGNQIALSLDNILFATDFSPSSETAKLYVQTLALDINRSFACCTW